MPNAHPPHRNPPLADPEDRMRMVELTLDGQPGLVPSRIEVDRGGISYTIDTLRELAQRFPGQRFDFLLGFDAARQIRAWHEARAILDEGWFVIFNRPGSGVTGDQLDQLGFPPKRTRLVHVETPPIAAHELRDRLDGGGSVDQLLPASVVDYIRRHHLYGT
jgi:nicotinate-nucleotide adenylyltransferase